jgi:hypothetical protein
LRRGCTAPASCRSASCCRASASPSSAQPATLAQRLGVRVSESALTGVKVTHVLRGGAAERLGLAAGDELIGVGGWRLRRLDDALRFVAPGGETPLVVSRDQRLLELRFDADALAGDERGAVQLRRADAASAEAQRSARHGSPAERTLPARVRGRAGRWRSSRWCSRWPRHAWLTARLAERMGEIDAARRGCRRGSRSRT